MVDKKGCKKGGKEPKGWKGRRRPLKKELRKATKGKSKLEEFYCLTCKVKRQKIPLKRIVLTKTKNGRNQAVAPCKGKGCDRKLYKFINKTDAERLKKLKK